MDILKRIDFVMQFAKEYADGAWSIETDKWKHHVTPEFVDDVRQYIVSLQLKLMHEQTKQAALRQAIAQPAATEWTVIAPDGTRFTGPTPLKAALPASKYRLEIDPIAAAKFMEIIDQEAEKGRQEAEQCMREYGTLDCPACGGSGHIGDVKQPALRKESRTASRTGGEMSDAPEGILFVDLIAQHPGLAEEMKAMDELTDERILEIAHRIATRYAYSAIGTADLAFVFNTIHIIDFVRAIEKEIRG